MGNRGRGFSRDSASSKGRGDHGDVRDLTRLSSFVRGCWKGSESWESSLRGVCGGVIGRTAGSVMVTWLKTEMEIVASEAISRASVEDRGVVVKTTKYGMEEARENVTDVGNVTAHRKEMGRSVLRGISSHELELSGRPSKE